MRDITDVLRGHRDREQFADAIALGWLGDVAAVRDAWAVADEVQRETGLAGGVRSILSDPTTQHKLGMAATPSYGLTLYHSTSRTHLGLNVNSCASAGDCIKLCVLNNSNGQYKTTQLAWRWRTNFLVHHPYEFFVILGRALWLACSANNDSLHQRILMRPNVNSDIEWHIIVPEMFDGSIFGKWVKFYGYSKHLSLLYTHPTGWVGDMYRVAYSWNEDSHLHAGAVAASVDVGGSVAVVTDRLTRGRQDFSDQAILDALDFLPRNTTVLDADLGDDWMFTERSAGDLTFKPRNRELRDWGVHSDFVVKAYGHSHQVAMF